MLCKPKTLRSALMWAATTAIAAQASGQQAAIFLSGTVLPVAGNPQLMATADFNGDGAPDLVYQDAYEGGNLHILLGVGDGTFTVGQVIPLPDAVGAAITLGDINGDGVPDIVLGYDGAAPVTGNPRAGPCITVLLGNGDGTFQGLISSPAVTTENPEVMNFQVGIGDFNNDGNPDVVFTDFTTSVYFMKGDGQGHLAPPVDEGGGGNGSNGDVFVAHVNNDNRPDLVIPSANSFNVYLGNGNGSFTAPVSYADDLPTTGPHTMFLYGSNNNLEDTLVLYYGDANGVMWAAFANPDGTFQPSEMFRNEPNKNPAIIGVTNGRRALAHHYWFSSPDGLSIVPEYVRLYPTVVTYAGTGSLSSQGVVADFNGDGLPDAAVPGNNSIAFLYGSSNVPAGANAALSAAPSVAPGNYTGNASVMDVNGDYNPDVVFGANLVSLGNGDGTFGGGVSTGTGAFNLLYTGSFYSMPNYYASGSLYYTKNAVSFNANPLTGLGPTATPTSYGVLAKFNGAENAALSTSQGGPYSPSTNGNSVVVATLGPSPAQSFEVYTTLNFTEPVGPLGAGDFNGDGCPDLVVGAATQIEIFNGNCKGGFTLGSAYATGTGATATGLVAGFQDSLEPSDIAVADFDGDGNLDIVYTVPGLSVAKVLYGNGNGTFSAGTDITLPYSSMFVTTADLNVDGVPDLIFSGTTYATVYYGSKGRNNFGQPTALTAGFNTGKAQVGDLNRDGNPDFIVPNLDYDVGGNSNNLGESFAVFVNQLAPRSSDVLDINLTAFPEPSLVLTTFTAQATFTAELNTAKPSGTAMFTWQGNTASAKINSAGVATTTFVGNAVGTFPLTVSYAADANFAAASASYDHQVVGYQTAIYVTCSPTTINLFGTAMVNVLVTSQYGTPAGSIVFTDNGAALATQTLSGGATVLTYTGNVAGAHTITASYQPAGFYVASTDSCGVVVNGEPSTAVLAVNPASSTYGSPVLLTATVSPANPPGTGTPTGTVTFSNGSSVLGTVSLSGGVATLSVSTLPAGTNGLTCTYSGDNDYNPSNCNTVSEVVNEGTTSLTLVSSQNPAPALTTIYFTAALTVNGQPGVRYPVSVSVNGQTSTTLTGSNGQTGLIISTLLPGTYPVTATYAGSANLLGSSASLVEVIDPYPTATNLTVTANPSYFGQTVTMTAVVTGGTAGIPGGNVLFYDGATLLASVGLDATGTAVLTSNTLAVGTHAITATYPATGAFGTSSSAVVDEVILPSGFSLTLSPSTITLGPGVTGTSTVQLTSFGLFSGPLALSYGAVPQYATPSLAPASVTLGLNSTGTSTFTLKTFLRSANEMPRRPGERALPMVFDAGAVLLLLPLAMRRRRWARTLGVMLAAAVVTALSGCTNSYYTAHVVAPGTYLIPITATDVTGETQTATLTVIVTP